MHQKISFSTYAVIGTMLFGMFFGAGNLIFPIQMGQVAGTQFWPALIGFLVTAIGLPFMGILAFGLSGSNGLRELAGRVHPKFGVVFAMALYLTIGPFFAIPRTATVPFVVGFEPFINPEHANLYLGLFSFVFFAIVYYFSLNPAKIIDYIGKYLHLTFCVSLFDGYSTLVGSLPGATISLFEAIKASYIEYLPLYSIGLGWILPAVVGAVIGYFWPTGAKKAAIQ